MYQVKQLLLPEAENGAADTNQLIVTSDANLESIKKWTDAIHRHGAVVFCQLHHPGNQGNPLLIGGKPLEAPSAIPSGAVNAETRALTTEEVRAYVNDFAMGAKRLKAAGADGVEIHAAHGYLLSEFLSPHKNQREDEYGGSLENRCRFIVEILKKVKELCGEDYPVSVRINGTDGFKECFGIENGVTGADAVEIAKIMEAAGADAISISSGTYETMNCIVDTLFYPQGWRNEYIKAVKDAVNIPVIGVSAIREPEYAEKLLEDGVLDFVGMGRTWLADSQWANKALGGHPEDIRKCISCLYCFETIMTTGNIECAVNPELGLEYTLEEPVKDGNGRPVAVIGGGPAGLEAARILSERGFSVTLFEAASKLGGQVYLGSVPPHKERMYWFIDYEEAQLKKNGVKILLNTPATAEAIKELNPYAVVVATGSNPVIPAGIKGVEKAVSAFDILSGKKTIEGKSVAIVGSGLTGLETAELLASQGKKVAIYEMQDKIGPDAYFQILMDITAELSKYNVTLNPSHKLVEIGEGKAVFEAADGEAVVVECDGVVLSLGNTPNNALVEKVKAFCDHTYAIGDADQTGRISHAVKAGYNLGKTLK